MKKQSWNSTSRYKKLTLFGKFNTLHCTLLIIFFIIIYLQYTHLNSNNNNKITLNRQHPIKESSLSITEDDVGWNRSEKLVIVVQVHNREMYLKHLIESLRGAAEIESVLLIFSHDYYDEKLNKLIATVDFCNYKQIYYPYSIQKYPNSFPGPDTVQDDKKPKRNATITQIKHHWWWKANTVFNWLSVQTYKGLVLFLEEDFYVIEDFVFALKQMEYAEKEFCHNCKILSLAVNADAMNIDGTKVSNTNQVQMSNKFSNMGIALYSTTWNEVVKCQDSFCKYNDYNWDFSLQNLLSTCMEDADTMMLMFPRIVHIGSCGVHVTSTNCDPSVTISKIKNKLTEVNQKLFPEKLLKKNQNHYTSYSRPNGGWEDIRDQELCRNMTTFVSKEL